MPIYAWEGRSIQGELRKGELEAGNTTIASANLRRQQITPLRIKEKKGKNIEITIPGFGGKVTEKEIVVFTRQFATMIDAGLPLVQCLEILSSQQDNKVFKKVISDVKVDVEGGLTFADALQKHPKIFSDLYVNLVNAGEAAGILDTILNRLSVFMEKAMKLKSKVKSAMVYPGTILSVAVIVIIIMMVFVIPTFEKMFEGLGGGLPAPTQFVLGLSKWFKNNILYIFIGAAVLVAAFVKTYKTEKGRRKIDGILLKLPIFGDLLKKVAVARFTRTLGTMISSGVPILEALDIVAKTAGNKIVEEAVVKTKESISEGKTIAEPLAETGVFPPMVVQMISVGETTGAMDAMLSKIADFYDDEVDTAVATLTSLLEPVLMIFLGVIIGGMVVTMYLPVFKLAETLG
jgi:type IV pilus assembly protein PilC